MLQQNLFVNVFIPNYQKISPKFVDDIFEQISLIIFNTDQLIVKKIQLLTSSIFDTYSLALNETRILLQTPMKLNDHTADELGHFLESYFSSCAQQIDGTGDIPHFQVRQDADVVQRFIKFYTEILEESKPEEQDS